MSDRDRDIEIYVADRDGTNHPRLTHSPGRDTHPAFSHDWEETSRSNRGATGDSPRSIS